MPALLFALILIVTPPQSRKQEIQDLKRQVAALKQLIIVLENRIGTLENKPDPTTGVKNDMLRLNAEVKENRRIISEELSRMNAVLLNLEKRVGELEKGESKVEVVLTDTEGAQTASEVPGEMVQEQLQQARLDFDAGKYQVAEIAFRDLLVNFPDSVFAEDCRFFLAQCRFQQKDYEQARTLFEAVGAGGSRYALQARLYEGQSHFHLGSYAKAIQIFDDLVLNNPDTQEADLARRFVKKNGLE